MNEKKSILILMRKARRCDSSRKVLRSYMSLIRDNNLRLHRCKAPHDFVPIRGATEAYKCMICGGMVSRIKVLWYRKGIRDAMKRGFNVGNQ